MNTFSRNWVWIPSLWLGAALIGLVAIAYALSFIADDLMKRSAERTALGYVDFLSRSTPRLNLLFGESTLNAETREHLERSRKLGDVFRFKMWDMSGRRLLVSDELDASTAPPAAEKLGGHHDGNAHVAEIVLGGRNYIKLKQDHQEPGRPPVYVEAYVPLPGPNGPVGVVEVYVDMSTATQQISAAFVFVGALVGGVVVLFGGGFALQMWRRTAERRRLDKHLQYLAHHDVLSGVLNRASFEEALRRAIWLSEQGGPGLSVLCIDLDRFKDVNDTFGHATGDEVLRQAAQRLRTVSRQGDVVARLGGDEFAILQSAVGSAQDMAQFGQRVVDTLNQPYEIMGRSIICAGSVGAARIGTDATTVAELLHRADVAMYRAKSSGGGFSFYDAELDAALKVRRELSRDLKEALTQGGLSLHYQPIYRHHDHALLGYEALMRWNHPQRGAVSPAEFIPLAEESGQIEVLGQWALLQACTEAVGWPESLTVSVNLSSMQFRGHYPLLGVIQSTLTKTGLQPERLVLEITESLLLSGTEHVLQTLNALSETGVQIAMDDFGTGYSSLAYLWRFPFDKIKIDRAFTQGLEQDDKVALIVGSIITLAHSMGLRVNAEGVETEAQRRKLEELGCDELQGFLLGRPAPSHTLDHAYQPFAADRVPDTAMAVGVYAASAKS